MTANKMIDRFRFAGSNPALTSNSDNHLKTKKTK